MVVGKESEQWVVDSEQNKPEAQMKNALYVVAAILILAGGVFFLQGMQVLPSRIMYGKPEWVVIGAVMVVGGIALGVIINRRGTKPK